MKKMKKTITEYIKEIIDRTAKQSKKEFEPRLKWRPVKTLAGRLNIEPREALIFSYAYFLTLTNKNFLCNSIREEISDSPFDIGIVLEIIHSLQQKKMINGTEATVNAELSVSSAVLSNISMNKAPDIGIANKNKDFLELCDDLSDIFWMRMEGIFTTSDFYDDLDRFFDNNTNFELFKFLKKKKIPKDEWLVFLFTIIAHLNGDSYASLKTGVNKLYRGIKNQFDIRTKMISGEAELIKKKLIEFNGHNLKDAGEIKVTNQALKEILKADYDAVISNFDNNSSDDDLIKPENIETRELFYNEEESNQMLTIQKIIKKDRLSSIQERLKKAGHKIGVCVLLHGLPGTGKTESVLQLAKMSGRSIMKVDISSVRDKFVGESEKNLKAIFREYEVIREKLDVTPILLFNEADALLNKRIKVRQSSDQMNNSMQNILLEELENFKGLLFATTNLAPNLDSAFERRFLYKVSFQNPKIEVRKAIWTKHFPNMKSDEIETIAEKYKLSGGQIENVVKKVKLDNIINGRKIKVDKLEELCKLEFLNSPKVKKNKIGYL